MRNMIIVVLVLSIVVFGDVIPGTLHYSDACEVDELMEAAGVYSGRVKILNFESLIVYAIEFPGDYFSWDSDDDVAEVSAALIAVAVVSASTSWHSDAVIILYEDDTIGMFTVDCRTAVQYVNEGYDITDFLIRNVFTGDRAASQLVL